MRLSPPVCAHCDCFSLPRRTAKIPSLRTSCSHQLALLPPRTSGLQRYKFGCVSSRCVFPSPQTNLCIVSTQSNPKDGKDAKSPDPVASDDGGSVTKSAIKVIWNTVEVAKS